jgi:hypothetical protein
MLLLLLLLLCLPQVWITIQRPGVFYGQCSELCGANHAFMPIVVEAVTPRQFVQVRSCVLLIFGSCAMCGLEWDLNRDVLDFVCMFKKRLLNW